MPTETETALEQGLEKMREERDLWKSRAQLAEERHRRVLNEETFRNRVQVVGTKHETPPSRRDLFAAAALQGLSGNNMTVAENVDEAVELADALIAELDKTPVAAKRRAGLWRGILGSPGHVRDARDIVGLAAASVLPKASYWQWRIAGGRGDGLADGSEDTAEKAQAAADEALRKAGWELES